PFCPQAPWETHPMGQVASKPIPGAQRQALDDGRTFDETREEVQGPKWRLRSSGGKLMQKITPHLWFDKEAKEAFELYASLFPNSKITNITTLHDTPSGDCDVVSFELSGQEFGAINAGSLFRFNPSISFHVKCKAEDEVDSMWEKLAKGGKVLLERGKYPFSERYG